MSTGANILSRLELEAEGLDIELINEMQEKMSTNVQQFPQSKERNYIMEILSDVYVPEE